MKRNSPAKNITNPQEESLHVFCKQMLKSRLFKGLYKERCYIDAVNGYRDQIMVNHNEKDLKFFLEDVERRLRQYYANKTPAMWIGINRTSHAAIDTTCIWAELDELAFDEYWFSIKTLRVRDNEIIIKLKPIRPVEEEPVVSPLVDTSSDSEIQKPSKSIGLQDFVQLIQTWGRTTKQTIYDFLANDISKQNLAAVFKFLILICISLVSFSVETLRFLGIFTIRFMMEFNKLLLTLRPIIILIIEVCSKVVGGLFILIAMIWRDVKTGGAPPRQFNGQNAIRYRPVYQSIQSSKKK